MLSIAICTHNRADQLTVLLDQLVACKEWITDNAELLIVDNASVDHTAEIIGGFAKLMPITQLQESVPGLARARNCALQNFRGEAILFLDDDVTITLETLQVYAMALTDMPACDFFAGPIKVDWQGPQPAWLKADDLVLLNGLFGDYNLGRNDLDYQADTLGPFGANFLLRRSMVQQLEPFNINLGVSGEHLGRGEETEYFKRAYLAGLSGKYLGSAVVGHRFQIERISLPHLYRYGVEKGHFEVMVNARRPQPRFIASVSFALRGIWQLLTGRRDRFYQCVINIGILVGVARAADKLKSGAHV